MAGENLNQKIQNSLLDNIQGTPDPTLNVGDFNNYTPAGLTPEQQNQYQQQQALQNQPTTGALQPTDYYPDLHHQIAVGNYGGSEVGNLTLFAPGGGLVPLGLMDARDMAIHKAALQKVKEADDWKKRNIAPETKHVAVQQELTDQYFNGLQQWENNALKQAGGDVQLSHEILKNSPGFNKWNQSMQDTAKFHNSIVEQSAQLEALEKDPNMVLSPAVRKANKEIISGIVYQGSNPFSTAGHDIGAKFLGLQAAADLDVKTNEVLNKAIPDIEQLPVQYTSRGKNETAAYLEREYFSPERVKNMAKNLYMGEYQGTGFTEEDVYNSLKDKIGEKIRRKTDTYDKWFKADSNSGEDDYTNAAPQTVSNFNFVKDGQTQSAYMENAYNTGANDQKKVLNFKISDKVKDVQGKGVQNETGNISGNVQQIGAFPYDELKKEFITREQYAEQKSHGILSHNIIWKAGALVNEIPNTTEEKEPGYVPNTYVVPVSELKGKLKNFDKPIEQTEKFVEEKNAHRKITPATTTPAKKKSYKGLDKDGNPIFE